MKATPTLTERIGLGAAPPAAASLEHVAVHRLAGVAAPALDAARSVAIAGGYDLSQVRVHTSAQVAGSARDHLLPSIPATGGAILPQPLQQRAQQSIQAQFDFSQVRIHRDGARAARHNAAAYTVGTDVVLGGEVGSLAAPRGIRLLGHELAHVVQQSRGGTRTTPPLPGHPIEQAADRAGQAFAAGRPGRVEGAAKVGIARTPRSLSRTLVPSTLSDSELEAEIREIRAWVMANPGSSSESNILEQALAGLEDEAHRRQTPSRSAALSTPPPVATTAARCPSGMCHQARPPSRSTLTPSMLPSTEPTGAEIEAIRRWIESDANQRSAAAGSGEAAPVASHATAPGPAAATAQPPGRWVPIVQHMHLGTFGDTVVIVTAPWQGAVQRTPDPSAGYNFDTYITNPKTGDLIPAQHLGGTRYRVFMGTPECPGCHFGQGLQVDIVGQNPVTIFGPTLVMTGSSLLSSRAAPLSAAGPTTARPGGGFTLRVIQGGGAAPAPAAPARPVFAGNTALQLDPTVAQAPVTSPQLSLVPAPAPAPVPVQPPVSVLSPVLPAVAAAAAQRPGASPGQDDSGTRRLPSMRSQIQRGDDHLGSAAVVATRPARGVTAREFEMVAMMGALADYRQRRVAQTRPFGVEANESNIIGSFARQSMRIRSSIVGTGVTQGGDINSLRERFTDAQTGRPIRVDVENNFGHNLRFAE